MPVVRADPHYAAPGKAGKSPQKNPLDGGLCCMDLIKLRQPVRDAGHGPVDNFRVAWLLYVQPRCVDGPALLTSCESYCLKTFVINKLASWEGVEPSTFGFGDRCSTN